MLITYYFVCRDVKRAYNYVTTIFNKKSIGGGCLLFQIWSFKDCSKEEYNSSTDRLVDNVFSSEFEITSKEQIGVCKNVVKSDSSESCYKINMYVPFENVMREALESVERLETAIGKDYSPEEYKKIEGLTSLEEIVNFIVNEHFEELKKGDSLDEETNIINNVFDSLCDIIKEKVIKVGSEILLDRSETAESWKGYVSEWTPEHCAKIDALTTPEEAFNFFVNDIADAYERRERGRILQYWRDLIEFTPEYCAKIDELTTPEETFNFFLNEHVNAYIRHFQRLESIVNNYLNEHYAFLPSKISERMQKKLVKSLDEYLASVIDHMRYVPEETPLDWDLIDDEILYQWIWPNFFYKNTLYTTFESLIITEYFTILIYLFFSILLSYAILGFSYMFVVQNPETEKMSAYECGFEPYEDARQKFDVKFYIIAMLFIIFDIETMYLIPWCSALPYINSIGYLIMMEFIFELSVGFLYIWCIGGFDWD